MVLFLAVLFLVAVLGLRKTDNGARDYMSVGMTDSVKGFFLVLVFFTHIWTYTDFSNAYLDRPVAWIRQMGQCVVVMFLFYSGYGVMESIQKKGQMYVKQIPIRRVLNVLFQFECAMGLFLVYRYASGAHYGWKKILLSLAGWESIGNSNWYVFCILWLYIFTFVSFRIWKTNYGRAVIGVALLSLAYSAVLHQMGKEDWWYNTILCYSWGMLFSLYRPKIEKAVNKDFPTWLGMMALLAVCYLSVYFIGNDHYVIYQWWVFCFAALGTVFTMRFVVDSKALRWLGKNLFGLYILQRLPMILLKPYMLADGATDVQKYAYVAVCFVATLGMAVVFRETIGRVVLKITRKVH